MIFTIPPPIKREAVGQITIELYDRDGSNPHRSIYTFIELTDNEGNPAGSWNGNIHNFLPQNMLVDLAEFLDFIRTEAVDKLLE